MDKRIYGTVNRTQKGETFLQSVTVEGPGAQQLLVRLFRDRNPMHFVVRGGMTALVRQDLAYETLDEFINQMGTKKAVIGEHNEMIFVIVSYAKGRLCDCLIRSARTLRTIKAPVRLIESEKDLLNAPVSYQPTRVYKDD